MTIATLTPEERQIALQKAQLSWVAKAAHNKANEHLYKLDYLDAPRWAELASKHNVRWNRCGSCCASNLCRVALLGSVPLCTVYDYVCGRVDDGV